MEPSLKVSQLQSNRESSALKQSFDFENQRNESLHYQGLVFGNDQYTTWSTHGMQRKDEVFRYGIQWFGFPEHSGHRGRIKPLGSVEQFRDLT
jgi:hypothetical protein